MNELNSLIERLRDHMDPRYPDYKLDAYRRLIDLRWLLKLIEKEHPDVYLKYLQYYHDDN